jgi:small subunit ribosomal protein S2
MNPYIFGKRNLIHIIDLRETVKGLLRAKKFIAHVVSEGGDVLFVGTKRQARGAVEDHARRCGMPFVTERWLGGTLTNFGTVRSRLGRLEELEAEDESGALQEYSKKAIATRTRERKKIFRNLSGIREMNRLPKALVIIDVSREHIAVREARKLGIPTVCLIDTDSDPDFADIPIPGNDDAIRSIDAVLKHLAGAVELGKKSRPVRSESKDDANGPKRRSKRVTARAEDDSAKLDSVDADKAAGAAGLSELGDASTPDVLTPDALTPDATS